MTIFRTLSLTSAISVAGDLHLFADSSLNLTATAYNGIIMTVRVRCAAS